MKSDAAALPVDMVVLCGGKGTRLGALTTVIPKPLLPIGGSPFLLRLLRQWHGEGVRRFILATHHLADQFRAFAEENSRQVGRIDVVVEAQPLGTGGGLRHAAAAVETPVFLVANGDSYVTQPLAEILTFHRAVPRGLTVTAVRPARVLGGARQKGRMVVGPEGNLRGFSTEESVMDGWVNAGLYAMDRRRTEAWPQGCFDLEKEIFPSPAHGPVGVFRSEARLLDIGIPECYATFDHELGPVDLLFSRVAAMS